MTARTVPVSRDGTNTIKRTEWPLVVVPGLLASRLEETPGGAKVWDPDDLSFTVGLMSDSPDSLARRFTPEETPARAMSEPGPKHLRTAELIRRGWGGPSWDFYGVGIEQLQFWLADEGAVVYAFGYDWRDSNLRSGKLLNSFIKKIKEETVDGAPRYRSKPIVVTHSNGGLVTRSACRQDFGEANIAAVLHTFMPTYGTPEAYTKFKLGEQSMLGKILGSSPEEIACIGGGVKTMGQLLPNHIYPKGERPWLTWDPQLEQQAEPRVPYSLSDPYLLFLESTGRIGLVNHRTFDQNAILIRNGVWATNTRRRLEYLINNINEAKRFHQDLVQDYIHPYTYLITGTGLSTSVGAHQHFYQATVYDVKLLSVGRTARLEGPGDGTVAELSGRAFERHSNCRRSLLLSGIEHSAAFNNGLVITGMLEMIRRARREVPLDTGRW